MKFKLSSQAIASLMMALQKGIMEQVDITEVLKDFEFTNTTDGLMVENPPILRVDEEVQTLEQDGA